MKKKTEPEIGMVMLPGCRCRCGHEWLPRPMGERPRVCPKCKSANWDREKKFERPDLRK
jgi:predicted Zn-ribbon and HTH transcriptional regulator